MVKKKQWIKHRPKHRRYKKRIYWQRHMKGKRGSRRHHSSLPRFAPLEEVSAAMVRGPKEITRLTNRGTAINLRDRLLKEGRIADITFAEEPARYGGTKPVFFVNDYGEKSHGKYWQRHVGGKRGSGKNLGSGTKVINVKGLLESPEIKKYQKKNILNKRRRKIIEDKYKQKKAVNKIIEDASARESSDLYPKIDLEPWRMRGRYRKILRDAGIPIIEEKNYGMGYFENPKERKKIERTLEHFQQRRELSPDIAEVTAHHAYAKALHDLGLLKRKDGKYELLKRYGKLEKRKLK